MTGEVHWLPVAMVLLGGAALAAYELSTRFATRHLQAQRKQLVCPVSHQQVEAIAVFNRATCAWTGLRSCSAFSNPENVTCPMRCVALMNRGA